MAHTKKAITQNVPSDEYHISGELVPGHHAIFADNDETRTRGLVGRSAEIRWIGKEGSHNVCVQVVNLTTFVRPVDLLTRVKPKFARAAEAIQSCERKG